MFNENDLTVENMKFFSREAALKENVRMSELKNSVITSAFNSVKEKLANSFGTSITLDSPKANLTEFEPNTLSGKIVATLSVDTVDGIKRVPVTFKVRASVSTLAESIEEIKDKLDKTEGSLEQEVRQIMSAQEEKLKAKEEEEKVAKEIEADILGGMTVEASREQRMFKQAAKQEVDMHTIQDNSIGNALPPQILTYPKTYLPTLKKDKTIINVGGFKYKYIGDEPTITGDTENGVIARFALIPVSKKASLDVKADDENVEIKYSLVPNIKSDRTGAISDRWNDDKVYNTLDEAISDLMTVEEDYAGIVESDIDYNGSYDNDKDVLTVTVFKDTYIDGEYDSGESTEHSRHFLVNASLETKASDEYPFYEDNTDAVSEETAKKYREQGFVEKGTPEYDEFYNAGYTLKKSLSDDNVYHVVELEKNTFESLDDMYEKEVDNINKDSSVDEKSEKEEITTEAVPQKTSLTFENDTVYYDDRFQIELAVKDDGNSELELGDAVAYYAVNTAKDEKASRGGRIAQQSIVVNDDGYALREFKPFEDEVQVAGLTDDDLSEAMSIIRKDFDSRVLSNPQDLDGLQVEKQTPNAVNPTI